MRSSRAILLGAALGAALGAVPSASRADENDSRTFFAQGRKLRAAGNCNDAITAFQRALDLWPQGIGSLRNIAECEETLGHYASARNSYWNLRRAALQSNDPNYEGWDKDAEVAYDRLATKVAKITLKVEGADADAVQVTIDGKPLDPRLIGVALERDLGNHELTLRYGGAAPLTEKRTLVAGSDEVVTFKVKIEQAAPSGSAFASAVPAGSPTTAFPYRGAAVGGFVLGGLGLIGVGVAIGVRQGALTAIESKCHYQDMLCPTSLQGERDTGVTASALVNVFAITAVVGAGAGLGLWLAAPSPRASVMAAAAFSPVPGGGIALGTVRF